MDCNKCVTRTQLNKFPLKIMRQLETDDPGYRENPVK